MMDMFTIWIVVMVSWCTYMSKSQIVFVNYRFYTHTHTIRKYMYITFFKKRQL